MARGAGRNCVLWDKKGRKKGMGGLVLEDWGGGTGPCLDLKFFGQSGKKNLWSEYVKNFRCLVW